MEWVLVADGAVAKILKRTANSLVQTFPTYHASELVEPLDKDSRRLGRVPDSIGATRHASYGPSEDYKDAERREFIRKIGSILNEHFNEYDRLVIVAPARRLKEISAQFSAAVRKKVTRVMTKDLIKMPLEKVYKKVAELPKK